MLPPGTGDRTFRQTVALYFVALVGVFAYFRFWVHKSAPVLAPFWDARVYQKALATWQHGGDPYAQIGPYVEHLTFLFVSPPAFLGLMRLARHLVPGNFGFHVYLLLTSLCTLALPALVTWAFFRGTWMSAPLALVLFAFPPDHYGTQALLTGNFSNVLYAAVIAATGWGLHRRQWLAFYLTLIFAGLMKPMFLAFLLIPVLAANASFLAPIVVTVLVALGYVVQIRAVPALFRGFQDNIRTQLIVHGDTGFGLLEYIARYLHHVPLLRRLGPSINDALLVAVLVGALFLLRRRQARSSESLWLPCLLVLAMLSNPRIQAYDADIALIPAAYILVTFLIELPPSPWKAFWVGTPVLLFVTLVSFDADLATCLFLLVSVLAVIGRLLWPAGLVRDKPVAASSAAGEVLVEGPSLPLAASLR